VLFLVCSGCGAQLIDGTKRCPFCREILGERMRSNSDVTYKIENNKQLELIRNSAKKNVSPRKNLERKKKRRRKRMIGCAILLGIAAVLISIIVGIISLIAYLFSDKTVYTTAYYADNEIGIKYDDEIVVLTDELFKNKNDIGTDFPDGIIQKSKNGKVTVFMDKFDKNKNQGRLKIISGSDEDDIITISENVYPSFKISDDGDYILFVKNANVKGNMGELWVYENNGEAVKISDKIDYDKNIFSFEYDKVIYIKDYDYKNRNGVAYYTDFSDYSEHKIDSKVYNVYGTAKDSNLILYSKEYKKDKAVYDIYMYDGEERKRLAENSVMSPVFCENGEFAFLYGDNDGERNCLYRVDFDDANVFKIDNSMSKIEKVSDDGEKVIYSKVFDNNIANYYIWTEGESELKVADGVNYANENQIDFSDDFEKVTYISNYDDVSRGGSLYSREYLGEPDSEAVKISDDVYSCYLLSDEKIVYTKDYDYKRKMAGLYCFDNIVSEINRKINPEFLIVDNEMILCLYDYRESSGGNLYQIDDDLNEKKIASDVFGYYLKQNGEIAIKKNEKNGKFDLYETYDGEVVEIKKGAEKILFY